MGPAVSAVSLNWGSMAGTLAAFFLPSVFEPNLVPVKMEAVYMPAWYIDAEMEGQVMEGEEQHVSLAVMNYGSSDVLL